MSDPVETTKPKKARRKSSKKNGAPETSVVELHGQGTIASSAIVMPTAEAPVSEKEAGEFAEIAIQSTKFGPNPEFMQGKPVGLVRAAIRSSMPPAWKEKGAAEVVLQINDPSLLVIMLTYFAAYWNLGFRVGFSHGQREAGKK